ncbi:toxin co-regulated pilus biosynthesis Q family protein [Asaia bogorensis]|uniref:PilL n=2 Tax=Asaia TaxID=91914 RepID=A0A060QM70_9PROT|nr:toxin co-regulated pilus biosynthesis Q family protein [Asaia bogorensis]CDG41012.1 PilL [Asaia bogorensis]
MRGTPSLAAACALIMTGITGCADMPADTSSQVAPGITFRDASRLTVTIADILAASLAPTRSTLLVAPVEDTDQMHIGRLLDDSLRERGFAVWSDGTSYAMAHSVQYRIAPVDGYVQLALYVDQASATCLYTHDADQVLVSTGSCTVRPSPELALHIPDDARLTHQMLAQSNGPLVLTPQSVGQTWSDKRRGGVVSTTPLPIAPQASAAATPMAVAPPAVVPVPFVATQSWSLVQGQPIRDQMLAWGDRAGWTVIWPKNMNWVVPVTTTFTGPYEHLDPQGLEDGVFSQVIRALSQQGKALSLKFWTTNHVAVVTNMGEGH